MSKELTRPSVPCSSESPQLLVVGERASALLRDGLLSIYKVARGDPLPDEPLLTLRMRHDVTPELVEECDPDGGRVIL